MRLASDISALKQLSGDEATVLLQTVSEYDNALVAMNLMVAESRPKEKEVITAMVTNLI